MVAKHRVSAEKMESAAQNAELRLRSVLLLAHLIDDEDDEWWDSV